MSPRHAPSPADAEIVLDAPPSLTPLLARVAVGALRLPGRPRRRVTGLPSTTATCLDVPIDAAHVADYAEVCGFRLTSTVPPTYLHLLGFPLSVHLMTRPGFPLGLLGLVHVHNTIHQVRPVGLEERVQVTASVGNLRPHPKGQQLDNVVEVRDGEGTVVWSAVSTYLRRGRVEDDTAGDAEAPDGPAADQDPRGGDELPTTSLWRVPADIGRRYGAVSGDRNPIHLHGLSARAFGFKAAIAHGMWTKARSLAALEGDLPDDVVVDVAFRAPLLLPATVEYATSRDADGATAIEVRSRSGRTHLRGTVTEGHAG